MGALPDGFGLVLDSSLRRFVDGTVLAGGRPGRVLTLTPAGARSLDALVAGGPGDPATLSLAGRLVAGGMAHPRLPDPFDSGSISGDVTVVVPTYGRPEALDRCLASLGRGTQVVVVDDASVDPVPLSIVCARYGARLVRRTSNGGPGAARQSAVETVSQDDPAFEEDRHRIMHMQIREGGYYPWLKFFFETGTLDEIADRNNNGIIDAIDDTVSLMDELIKKGYVPGRDIKYLELNDGKHDVDTWGKAFPEFLKWGWVNSVSQNAIDA